MTTRESRQSEFWYASEKKEGMDELIIPLSRGRPFLLPVRVPPDSMRTSSNAAVFRFGPFSPLNFMMR